MRDPIYANRKPAAAGEPLTVRREGRGFWHARDAAGALIAVDQYQNDLMPRLTRDGFSPTKIEGSAQ
ncbi:hypothetical protein ACOI1H_13400 [Loktanella sp. DJP18]|uniref:hypothetical protein n=1 Tax=Loktanella sp. DJP18 TaxID=3409788 RepID=UPI003BB602AC